MTPILDHLILAEWFTRVEATGLNGVLIKYKETFERPVYAIDKLKLKNCLWRNSGNFIHYD